MSGSGKLPNIATDAVLKQSVPIPDDFEKVQGMDFSQDYAYNSRATDLIASMRNMGFQALSVASACDIINEMKSS